LNLQKALRDQSGVA